MNKLWHYLYETKRGYRFNPCDVQAFAALQPLGRALASVAGRCPCCAGARLLAATTAAALAPGATLTAAGALLVALTVRESFRKPESENPDA